MSKTDFLPLKVDCLVILFNDISTLVGYLKPDLVFFLYMVSYVFVEIIVINFMSNNKLIFINFIYINKLEK